MLVLSRNKNESIIIGDDIEIVIADIRGDKVRLGITAPKAISVHRKEVYEAIQKELNTHQINCGCSMCLAEFSKERNM